MSKGISFKKKSTAVIYCFFTVPMIASILVAVSRIDYVEGVKVDDLLLYRQFTTYDKVKYIDARKRIIYIDRFGGKFFISCGNPDYPSDCIKYNKYIKKDERLTLKIAKISQKNGILLSVKNADGYTAVKESDQIRYINTLRSKSSINVYIYSFLITFIGTIIMMIIPAIFIIRSSGRGQNV